MLYLLFGEALRRSIAGRTGKAGPRAKIRLIAVLGGRRRAFGRLGRLNDPQGRLGWEDTGYRRQSLCSGLEVVIVVIR